MTKTQEIELCILIIQDIMKGDTNKEPYKYVLEQLWIKINKPRRKK